jgi:hypothetical protein
MSVEMPEKIDAAADYNERQRGPSMAQHSGAVFNSRRLVCLQSRMCVSRRALLFVMRWVSELNLAWCPRLEPWRPCVEG